MLKYLHTWYVVKSILELKPVMSVYSGSFSRSICEREENNKSKNYKLIFMWLKEKKCRRNFMLNIMKQIICIIIKRIRKTRLLQT